MPTQQTRVLDAQVASLAARHGMLTGIRRLGIAVSGGSDSVALLRLLIPLCHAAGVTPVVLHFDHRLRGAASAADARFVARLAGKLDVACRLGAAGSRPAATGGRSLEMAARAARQAFLQQAVRRERLDAIATGHTADDVAETLLLRLARGSGATGLSGLRPVHAVSGLRFVRPLLDCTHAALRAWLQDRHQSWREDASNDDTRMPRNLLRHAVLPWLEQHWSPSIRAMLTQSASILRDEDALLEELARQAVERSDGGTVRRWNSAARSAFIEDEGDARSTKKRLSSTRHPTPDTPSASSGHRCLHLPPATVPIALQRRIIRQWLLAAGYPDAAGWSEIETILAGARKPDAWQVSLPGRVRVRAEHGVLHLIRPAAARGGSDSPALPDRVAKKLKLPGRVLVAGVRVTARASRGIVQTSGPVGTLPSACSLDAAALRGQTLQVRTRRPGDRIHPLGLSGSKSLQDLFVDAKVPAGQRDHIPLLVVANEVVWVPGYRVARKYAVQGPQAKAVRVEMQRGAKLETRN